MLLGAKEILGCPPGKHALEHEAVVAAREAPYLVADPAVIL
jgi:hypothetical protein